MNESELRHQNERFKDLLRQIGYPRRGTEEECMDIFDAARLIQVNFSLQDLSPSDVHHEDEKATVAVETSEISDLKADIKELSKNADQEIGDLTKENQDLAARLAVSEKARDGMRKGIIAVEELMRNSMGVVGLHKSGEIAEWAELATGGRYEDWLAPLDEAIKIMDAALSEPLHTEQEQKGAK